MKSVRPYVRDVLDRLRALAPVPADQRFETRGPALERAAKLMGETAIA